MQHLSQARVAVRCKYSIAIINRLAALYLISSWHSAGDCVPVAKLTEHLHLVQTAAKMNTALRSSAQSLNGVDVRSRRHGSLPAPVSRSACRPVATLAAPSPAPSHAAPTRPAAVGVADRLVALQRGRCRPVCRPLPSVPV